MRRRNRERKKERKKQEMEKIETSIVKLPFIHLAQSDSVPLLKIIISMGHKHPFMKNPSVNGGGWRGMAGDWPVIGRRLDGPSPGGDYQ